MIRKVRKEDFEQVYEIEKTCFVDPYPREQLEYEFSSNPVNVILVAEEDSKVIGFIDFMITFNSATIVQVAVLPEYRGRHIATNLLKEMENTFPKDVEDIVESITLEVRTSNEPAINLYKKDGYEPIVIKKHYYADGEDALDMVKRTLLCQ